MFQSSRNQLLGDLKILAASDSKYVCLDSRDKSLNVFDFQIKQKVHQLANKGKEISNEQKLIFSLDFLNNPHTR